MLLRWNSGVGGQRKPVNPGSAGARACRKCFDITKARANPSTFLSGPFPKDDTLCDRGSHGARLGSSSRSGSEPVAIASLKPASN